jgi:hypothetical protein
VLEPVYPQICPDRASSAARGMASTRQAAAGWGQQPRARRRQRGRPGRPRARRRAGLVQCGYGGRGRWRAGPAAQDPVRPALLNRKITTGPLQDYSPGTGSPSKWVLTPLGCALLTHYLACPSGPLARLCRQVDVAVPIRLAYDRLRTVFRRYVIESPVCRDAGDLRARSKSCW